MYFLTKNSLFHNICLGVSCVQSIRSISSAEIAKALRPFYFIVHPDLFGRHPKERSINEESLKILSAHLEASQRTFHQHSAQPKTLNFYIRNKDTTVTQDNLKLIRVEIDRDAKAIIKTILETCGLSTEYVNTVKTTPTARPSFSHAAMTRRGNIFYDGVQFRDESEVQENIEKTHAEKTLQGWLNANLAKAHTRTAGLNNFRDDVQRLEISIAKQLSLKEIQYDCGWNVAHYRGCLKSLERLVSMHASDMHQLKGRTVVFAPCSGVNLNGHIMLSTGDVQHNWLDLIKNISKQDDYLKRIPSYELALSQVLLDISIARRKFMPKAQVVNYAAQLCNVTTSILDYLTYNQYPKAWPNNLKDFELVIESEAGPLMVSPTGQFIAPSTCPGVILVDFVTQHLEEATNKISDYRFNKYIERDLHAQCIRKFQLQALSKDDSVDPSKMISCMKRLLQVNGVDMKATVLHITNYYSVMEDGTVCVPWDWKPV